MPITHIILAGDGRYSMLGRDTAPSRAEVVAAGAAAAAQGQRCWHALMHGEFHGRRPLTIELVEPLTASSDPLAFSRACNIVMARRAPRCIRRARPGGCSHEEASVQGPHPGAGL